MSRTKITAYDFLSQKYMLALLAVLQQKKIIRFRDLTQHFRDLSPTTLTKRLRALEKYGIVKKHVYRETPPRVEYVLTSSTKTLQALFSALTKWDKKHFDKN